MKKLKYTFKNDTLFKMLFVKYPDLLKRLVAELLSIQPGSIEQFVITNPEMPPEMVDDAALFERVSAIIENRKYRMQAAVNSEATLMFWEVGQYINSIVLETKRAAYGKQIVATLSPQLSWSHIIELPKLPAADNREDEQKLWLTLFKAETEEQLKAIEAMEVPIMEQAIKAYRHIIATDEFQEIERLRDRARRNEASALGHARREGRVEGEQTEREKWRGVVADKDALIVELRSRLGEDK